MSRTPFELPVACLVKRKDYRVIESLFHQFDIDQDEHITRTEFEEMSMQAFEALPMFSKAQARKRLTPHLSTMWESMPKSSQDGITMPQLLGMFYPHVSKRDIARCIKAYSVQPRAPRSSKEKLRAVPGATEELQEMFNHWDNDGDGIVTWSGLSSPLRRAGVSVETAKGWLRDARKKEIETKMAVSETRPEDESSLRSSDEMTFDDAVAVFSSNYIAESPTSYRLNSAVA